MGVYKRGTIWYIDYYAGYKRIGEKIGPSKRQRKLIVPGFFVRGMGSAMGILEKLLKEQERETE